MNSIVFIDTEVNPQNNQLLDLGKRKNRYHYGLEKSVE